MRKGFPMTLARRSSSSAATFGQRNTGPSRKPGSVPVRKPTVSGRPQARAAEAAADALETVASEVVTAASRGRAYAYACLSGTATFIAVLFVLGGVESRVFQAGPMLIFLAIPVVPTLALVLYIPTVVLSDVARLLSVPRGFADIGIGFVLGLGVGVAYAATSADGPAPQIAIATTLGGIVGGWAFWRAQGYPGLSSGSAAAFDLAYRKIK